LEGFEVATNPENSKASPNGWSTGTSTIGNNVDSRIGSQRVDGGASKNFDAQWDATLAPSAAANKVAAIVNNFYVSNMVHDITYQYGFDEQWGNFQEDNYGKGGQGSDSVTINNQASGSNNANFATPADGQNPTMNMFTWDKNTPNRDGSLENGVPIHEYGHGVSNRLTGGPSQSGCLSNTESGGMGEGWSDMLAMVLTQKPEFTVIQPTRWVLMSAIILTESDNISILLI
jgi:extracellular elastinolytic metalloproteinase